LPGISYDSGFIRFQEKILRFMLFALLMAISLMVFAQVLLRYVFKAPLMGIEEMLMFPTVWLYFLGGTYASLERSQIVARVLEVFVKNEKTVFFIRAVASVISLVVLIWLTTWGWDFIKYSIRMSRVSGTLYIPLIYAEISVIIGLVMMTFYTVLEIFYNFKVLRGATPPVPDKEGV
jgi:TRAP-type C4-dicarboxylate transport system permease small subunit